MSLSAEAELTSEISNIFNEAACYDSIDLEKTDVCY